jgi:sugar O-acyltransferase (sialic acid O-acetyltransferase NeuD family)
MQVLIIGAGGHGQVVADILLRAHERTGAVEPVGYLDDDLSFFGRRLLGVAVRGTVAHLTSIAHDAVVVAIGDNATRRRVFERLLQAGEQFVAACHPRAVVAPDVTIGAGTMICAGVVTNPCSVIGSNAILNTSCSIDHHNLIGNHVHVSPGVHLGGEVVVAEGALVGIGATVVPRRRVGAWSVVGAGSLVCHDVPDGATVIGSPARVVDSRR